MILEKLARLGDAIVLVLADEKQWEHLAENLKLLTGAAQTGQGLLQIVVCPGLTRQLLHCATDEPSPAKACCTDLCAEGDSPEPVILRFNPAGPIAAEAAEPGPELWLP
jgi:hypothetical protein